MSAQHTLDEARLIAAAPELLAAQQAAAGLPGDPPAGDEPPPWDEMRRTRSMRPLIQKKEAA